MNPYILGLDLGSASIGWAMVEANQRLLDCGVRIFDPGVNLDDFTKGREGSSNNVVRRTARLHRRQLRRRAARQRDLFRLLQEHKLLPSNGGPESASSRHELLQRLDGELRKRWMERLHQEDIPEQLLIYLLRKHALDQRLEPDELGRVIYQLGQRRGFKSNRRDEARAAAKAASEGKNSKKEKPDDEDLGKVKAGIGKLSDAMHEQGARTLGEYLLASSLATDWATPVRCWSS